MLENLIISNYFILLLNILIKKDNLIQQKSFKFALLMIELNRELIREKEYVISKQLLKSWTSIWANIEEAIAGSSRKDFINKLRIARKEARETEYRLKLLYHSKCFIIDVNIYMDQIIEILKILTSIIKTTSKISN